MWCTRWPPRHIPVAERIVDSRVIVILSKKFSGLTCYSSRAIRKRDKEVNCNSCILQGKVSMISVSGVRDLSHLVVRLKFFLNLEILSVMPSVSIRDEI